MPSYPCSASVNDVLLLYTLSPSFTRTIEFCPNSSTIVRPTLAITCLHWVLAVDGLSVGTCKACQYVVGSPPVPPKLT